MTITNGYCTLDEAKARLWPTGAGANTTENTLIEDIIMASSRKIDDDTHRRFYTTANDETRTFHAVDFDCMYPGDLLSITSLKTDRDGDGTFEETWTTSDYVLAPLNATLTGKPYTRVQIHPYGQYTFPLGNYAAVQIVGKFGFTTHPLNIKEACLIRCLIEYQAKNAFGLGQANHTFEQMETLYQEKISSYVRRL